MVEKSISGGSCEGFWPALEGPRWSQDGPKRRQDEPSWGQGGAKIPSNTVDGKYFASKIYMNHISKNTKCVQKSSNNRTAII